MGINPHPQFLSTYGQIRMAMKCQGLLQMSRLYLLNETTASSVTTKLYNHPPIQNQRMHVCISKLLNKQNTWVVHS